MSKEMCNGNQACHTAEDTGEPWYYYCEECDAERMWVSLPEPHEKDKNYE